MQPEYNSKTVCGKPETIRSRADGIKRLVFALWCFVNMFQS